MKYLTQLKPRELKKVFELAGLKILDDDFRDNFEWVKQNNKDYMYVKCQDTQFDIEEYKKRNPLICEYASLFPDYASLFPDSVSYSNILSDINIYAIDDYMLFRVGFDMDTEIYPRDKEINQVYMDFMQKRFAGTDYNTDRKEYINQITNEEKEL